MRLSALLLAFALPGGMVSAHEHWILAEPDPDAGDTLRLRICSGHAFPKSEILLKQSLLTGLTLMAPDGTARPFTPEGKEGHWEALAKMDSAGVWVASFALQRPKQKEAVFRGRALFVNGAPDDPARYATGQGLEIVPGAPVSALKPGDTLPVAVQLDGKPVAASLQVIPEKGRSATLSTGPDRPASVKIAAPGAMVLMVAHEGKSFSLTFSVRKPE